MNYTVSKILNLSHKLFINYIESRLFSILWPSYSLTTISPFFFISTKMRYLVLKNLKAILCTVNAYNNMLQIVFSFCQDVEIKWKSKFQTYSNDFDSGSLRYILLVVLSNAIYPLISHICLFCLSCAIDRFFLKSLTAIRSYVSLTILRLLLLPVVPLRRLLRSLSAKRIYFFLSSSGKAHHSLPACRATSVTCFSGVL